MSQRVTIERGPALLLAGAIIAAGIVLGVGAFLGGYALDDDGSPEETQSAPSERVYTPGELREALDGCGREDVEIVDGVAVMEPVDEQTLGACVLTWLEASGPVRADYSTGRMRFGETDEAGWSNVRVEWDQVSGGRQTTITVG